MASLLLQVVGHYNKVGGRRWRCCQRQMRLRPTAGGLATKGCMGLAADMVAASGGRPCFTGLPELLLEIAASAARRRWRCQSRLPVLRGCGVELLAEGGAAASSGRRCYKQRAALLQTRGGGATAGSGGAAS